MSEINAEIHVDFSGIEKKVSPENFKRGQVAFLSQALLDMEKYVPMRDGDLRASGHTTDDSLVWTGVYARAQFYGTNGYVAFRKYTTPGTGKRWDKRVTPSQVEDWGRTGLKAMGIQ